VRTAAEKYIEWVREGNGPYFLEIMTYRYRGHSMGDPERYRKPEEIKKWQQEDPIGIYHSYLKANNLATDEELAEMEKQVEADVQDAIQFAESSPEPAPETLFDDIYVE
jgi:pyruvate dehydrogenase E1 component alpha subunit